MVTRAQVVDSIVAQLQKEWLALEHELEDARNELELRRRRLAELSTAASGAAAKVSRSAVVILAGSTQPGPVSLSLEYTVPGARWSAGYEHEEVCLAYEVLASSKVAGL
jgi:hypothetical protein